MRLAVESGKIRDIQYWIFDNRIFDDDRSRGYWTVYVDVQDLTKPDGRLLSSEEDVDEIMDVHGGCTYFGSPFFGECSCRVVAGWDYMHGYDIEGHPEQLRSKQTLEEVKADVASALNGFIKAGKDER